MIPIYDIKNIPLSQILRREEAEGPDISAAVADILRTVRREGDGALRRYAREFDRAELTDIQVSPDQIQAALEALDPSFRAVLEEAEACRQGGQSVRTDRAVPEGLSFRAVRKVGEPC